MIRWLTLRIMEAEDKEQNQWRILRPRVSLGEGLYYAIRSSGEGPQTIQNHASFMCLSDAEFHIRYLTRKAMIHSLIFFWRKL